MCTRAHKSRCAGKRRQRGAALLVLLTLVVLGAAALFMTSVRSDTLARERQALRTMGEARDALLGYALIHGRLPRPSPQPSSGWEHPSPCVSEQQCTGYLPWSTLGLPPMYARGKPLRYSVTPAFSTPGMLLRYAVPTKTVAVRRDNRLQYVQGRPPCDLVDSCAPAVLVASGKYQGGGGEDQRANDVASRHFIRRPASDRELEAGGAFDDLVVSLSYDLLIRRASSTGALDRSR